MKAKRIALVYVKGFVENVASVEKAFNNIVNDLVSEGRTISLSTPITTKFTDGTSVSKVVFGSGELLGSRLTHLYIDDKILELGSGEKYVNEVLKPLVIQSGVYKHFDAEGSPTDRVMTFGLNGFKKLEG